MGQFDLDGFQTSVGGISDYEPVIMTGEGGREPSYGGGEKEGRDAIGLGHDRESESRGLYEDKVNLIKLPHQLGTR